MVQLIAVAASFLLLASAVSASPSPVARSPRFQSLADVRRERSHKVARGDCKAPSSSGNGTPTPVIPAFDADLAQVYRYRSQQGVNLGNWFVHEEWMGSSTFVCATGPAEAEIDIASGSNAKAILEHQWDTFITEDDFSYLASVGINTVRMPLGFWSLGPNFTNGSIFDKYGDVYEGSWPRVLQAITWAGKYGIGVLADMHGAYGSQNGQAHSGVSDGKTNLFTSTTDQQMTIKALVYMTEQLSPITNVVGIEILNEPQNAPQLLPFYTSAITAMRAATGGKDLPLYVHDAFDISEMSKYVGARSDFVVVDHHSYFVFTDSDQSTPVTGLTSQVTGSVADSIKTSTQTARGNLVTDEWGCALADGSTHVSDLQTDTEKYCQGQESVYRDNAPGYAFWSYNLDGCEKNDGDGWCFKGSVGNLLPATFFSYKGQTTPYTGIAVDGNTTSSNTTATTTTSTGDASTTASSDDTATTASSDDSASSVDSSASTTSAAPSATTSISAKPSACKAQKKRRSGASATGSGNARRRHHARAHALADRSSHTTSASDSTSTGTTTTTGSGSGSAGYTAGAAFATQFHQAGQSKVGFVTQLCKDVKGADCDDSYLADFTQGVSDTQNTLGGSN